MIYYCDTEFTSFNGDLLSIALVPEDESEPYFYEQIKFQPSKTIDPWVKQNVLPKMDDDKWNDRAIVVSFKLQKYLQNDPTPVIVADWPEDLAHFMRLLITGPGTMVNVDNIKMVMKRTGKWNSADHSKMPHHALHDAIAIREYWKNAVCTAA